jgi:hypothetical protein
VARGGPPFDLESLLQATGQPDLESLWWRLGERPYPAVTAGIDPTGLDAVSPGATERLRTRAERAVRHEVNLLGSGWVALGPTIDWHSDFKSGLGWPPQFFRDISYSDLDRPSDVKVPWDLSRLQWLVPAAQMFVLEGDERYAAAVRDVLDQWISTNPYGASVNWACTMEVALRILTWSWLFHACHRSGAWEDAAFRVRFLTALWLHGRFTIRHLEVSPVAGNHYTADAAGLVFAGLFFGGRGEPARWRRRGWAILETEIERQTHPDGMNHEASIPYHRLILELFHFPAAYRAAHNLPVGPAYRAHLLRMARYTRSCIRPDGLVPVVGDGDDARALCFGTQDINDHRYLPPLVVSAWEPEDAAASSGGGLEEVAWVHGAAVAAGIAAREPAPPGPAQFPAGGAYVLRSGPHYAYVDCGPVGLRGRGGHGHNDCLSLELALDGHSLVTDCGSYLYTSDYRERNRFRSTDAHNTPAVDRQELNRLVDSRSLWILRDDAQPRPRVWDPGPEQSTFIGGHTGYLRLDPPVMVWRGVRLAREGWGGILDRVTGLGTHEVSIPLHLSPGVRVIDNGGREFLLRAADGEFELWWEGNGWCCTVEPARVSPSYGIAVETTRLRWSREGPLPAELSVVVALAELRLEPGALLANLRLAVDGALGKPDPS